MYEALRAWFDTFDSDPYTVAVVGALVDVAESAAILMDGHDSTDDGLSRDAREALEALEDLEEALGDAAADAPFTGSA